MKNVILIILFLFSSILLSQKVEYLYCKIINNNSEIMEVWKDRCYLHWYGDFLTVGTENREVLNLLSPSSLFDKSNFRVFIRVDKVYYDQMSNGGFYKKTVFKEIDSNFELVILTSSYNNFFMFALNPSMTLVMDNLREKPKKKRR
tara:strand:+ start:812 stop:1249 length:438 start_codon:yes stop_codon:yes gene_type:complete